jgi:hypothetical protein
VSDRRPAAKALLERLGIDADRLVAGQLADDALAAAIAGPEGEAMAAALAEFPSPPVAAALAALEARAPDRTVRKAIRRALYRLSQRGVPLPERPPAATPPPRTAAVEPEAFVTAFGGDGDRLVWMLTPLAAGGAFLVSAHVHEPRGLLELTAAEVGRKRVREARQQLQAQGIRFVAVDWRIADALLVEAHERAGAPDARRDYLRVRRRITSEPPAVAEEPRSTHASVPAAEEASPLVAASAELLATPEIDSWGAGAETVRPFVEELAAAQESPLVLSRGAEEDRRRDVVRRAAVAVFPPPSLARRLEGTAYVLAETGRVPLARQALAVAATLRAHPAEAATVPLVAALVERTLGHLVARDTERRAEERRDALVVTPGQFLRDRASSRPGRTRG